jgi:putative membrane protein insertion efficiency factor
MLTRVAGNIIVLYQKFLSPLSGPTCRFHPSCSEYCRQSLEYHGLVKGSLRSIIRILKCHPFHPGGYDPVK